MLHCKEAYTIVTSTCRCQGAAEQLEMLSAIGDVSTEISRISTDDGSNMKLLPSIHIYRQTCIEIEVTGSGILHCKQART